MHDPYAGALRAVCSTPTPAERAKAHAQYLVGGTPLRREQVGGGPMSQAFSEIFREIFFPYTAPPPEINPNREIAEEQQATVWVRPESPMASHDGGPRPLAGDTMVEVQLRNEQRVTSPALYFRWGHTSSYDDIVAYRVALGTPDAEGWFDWPGGPCPAPSSDGAGHLTLDLRWRDEEVVAPYLSPLAESLDWFHTDHPFDIVCFRLRPKPVAPPAPKIGDPYKGGIFLGRTDDQHDLILHRVPV